MGKNVGEKNPMFGKSHSDETKRKIAKPKEKYRREKSPKWKGGRRTAYSGYVEIFLPEHHRARKNGYVFEHILIAEVKYGRKILAKEQVHHIDGNKQNNEPSNLEVLSASEHSKITAHNRRSGEYLNCLYCNGTFYRKPSHVKKSKYCSKKCHSKGMELSKYRTKTIPFHLIKEQTKQGKTLKDIATFFGVCENTIQRKIKNEGFKNFRGLKENVE